MRECFRHLMQNYIKQFTGQEHMYPVACEYRPDAYEHHEANVVGIDGLAHWLKEHHSLFMVSEWFQPKHKV
jgi:hypothetical protein